MLIKEFDKQVLNLIKKSYPKALQKTEKEFHSLLEPLRKKIKELPDSEINLEKGHLPFIIVVKSNLIPTKTVMSLVEKNSKNGVVKLFPREPSDFKVVDNEEIPSNDMYLLADIDRGKENINLPPVEAIKLIRKVDRHPLTIDEGMAIITQYPEFLMKNNCFSLLASRCVGDKRVPAIWINANNEPNLGWCWDGNPHTWLGSASCRSRIGC